MKEDINKLCKSCKQKCKQSSNVVVAVCPQYDPIKKSKKVKGKK